MNKQENIPALRFPEFTGNWVVKKLGEIVKINQGLQIAISERYTEQGDDTYFYITNEFLKEKSEKKYFIKNPPKSVICSKDDILMTRTGNTGMVVTGVEGAFHNNFFKVAYPSSIHKDYLCNFLKLNPTQVLISKLAGTSTIPDLNHSDFYKIQMPVPSFPEQQKIATFLSSVDEKLQGLKKKKSLLEAYKKGMMQRLFSQTLRFKDDNGEGFPEWEEERIENLSLSISSGKSNIKESQEIGNVPFYGSTGIIGYSAKFDYTGKSILIARVGANAGFLYKVDGNYCVSDNTLIYKITENVNFNFIYFILSYENLNTLVFGSGQPLITGGQLKQLKLQIPTLPEQTKIANFLSAIDEKIAKVSQEIEQVTVWKKGLLQQLFV